MSNTLPIIENCNFFSGYEDIGVILKRDAQGMYCVIISRKNYGFSRSPIIISDNFPTVKEAFENTLGKSADGVHAYILHTHLDNDDDQDNEDDDGDDDDDDDETSSLLSLSSFDEDEDYCPGCMKESLVDPVGFNKHQIKEGKSEASGNGDGQKGRGNEAGNATIVLPWSCNVNAQAQARAAPATMPIDVVKPGAAGIVGHGAGNGQARLAGMSLASAAAPMRPLPPCPGGSAPGQRGYQNPQAQAQGQVKTTTYCGPSQQNAVSNSTVPPVGKKPFPAHTASVSRQVPEPPSTASLLRPHVGTASAVPRAPLDPRAQAINRPTNWSFRISIVLSRQPRGAMAQQQHIGPKVDGDYQESDVVLHGPLTREFMRHRALMYVREHSRRFGDRLDILPGRRFPGKPGQPPSKKNRRVEVDHLCTTVTQAVFPVVVVKPHEGSGGGVPKSGLKVLDVEKYDREDLSMLCAAWAANWRMAGMGQIPWIPEFEVVVSDLW